MKKQYKRMISIGLAISILSIYTVTGSNFFSLSDNSRGNLSVNTIVVKAADLVVTEVVSSWLLSLLATLGVSSAGYTLTQIESRADYYVGLGEYSYSAQNTDGVSFVVNNITYKIKHPDGVSSLSDSFAQRVRDAIADSPEAAAEFQRLIDAIQNGVEITGGMLKNLWLMLGKGVVDDYNEAVSNEIETFESEWCDEWEICKYDNWSQKMKDVYNSGYKSYVFYTYYGRFCVALFPQDFTKVDGNEKPFYFEAGENFDMFGIQQEENYFKDVYMFMFTDNFDTYFPDNIVEGWEEANTSQVSSYGRLDGFGVNDDTYTSVFYCHDIHFWRDHATDQILGFPVDGETVDNDVSDVPYVLNPSDVITDMPAKIVNDDVITIPDGTTVDDVVNNPDLPGEIVGELVPVNEIDYPWENVSNPDVDIPVDVNPELDTNDYKIKPTIIDKFPFCIPWDIIKCFSLLGQEPEVPKFEYRFYIKSLKIDEKIVLDLNDFEPVANVTRWFFRLIFIFGLAMITRNQIRG